MTAPHALGIVALALLAGFLLGWVARSVDTHNEQVEEAIALHRGVSRHEARQQAEHLHAWAQRRL